MASRVSSVLIEDARSFAQMFLPSTTPAKRYLPAGKPALLTKSSVLVPRTRSNPKPEMLFKAMMVLKKQRMMNCNNYAIW